MGIDPVTHKPRLDLLQLYSVLNSTVHNSSQLHVSSLLGNIGPILNPDLLNLATSYLSCQGDYISQDVSPKNFQDGQVENNQFQCLQPNELPNQIQACPDTLTAQFLYETQISDANLEQLSCNPTNFSCQNSLQSSWHTSGESTPDICESFMSNYVYHDSNHKPITNDISFETLPGLSFSSFLSTPSSSTTPLRSSSTTCVNVSTEDEKDSYCSNMLVFGIPSSLDASRLI
ncbi:hypothetical protein SADUNF_Sadunf16G0271500 [Salix dunnii]|uniref:Uncharacterized protein n=1 Tax=Salix dunnii TaxID=1413687 RepID=A0A835JE26_9ROSI|nr:hypothetical protein SADUNF_Sadunf16G0271500 [Salix dunnii]